MTDAPTEESRRDTGAQPPAKRNGDWLRTWGPIIFGAVAALGFIWKSWIQPGLADSFVTSARGASMQAEIRSNKDKAIKLEMRVQRVEDAIVVTRDAILDIKTNVREMRRRKQK